MQDTDKHMEYLESKLKTFTIEKKEVLNNFK